MNYIGVRSRQRRLLGNSLLKLIFLFSEENKQGLDRDIASSKLEDTLQQMKLRESPGLEGLTLEFYRFLKDELIPHMQETFRYCLEQGEIHASWKRGSY